MQLAMPAWPVQTLLPQDKQEEIVSCRIPSSIHWWT
jgi:hypothetical protein